MTPDDPRHGSHAGALAHWRSDTPLCLPCRVAARRFSKLTSVRLSRGIRNRIPLGQRAWDILNHVGCTKVAAETGLWRNNLYRMRRGGPEQIVLRASRDAILRVQAPTAVGVQRRVRGLAAQGHTIGAIAAAAGVCPEGLRRLARKSTLQRVEPHVIAGVIAAVTQLGNVTPPPGRQTSRRRTTAAQRGWLPLDVWDDIDDPNEDPLAEVDPDYLDPVLVDRIIAGDYTLLEQIPNTHPARGEVCRRWHHAGRSLADLERRSGWRVATYFRARDEAVSA